MSTTSVKKAHPVSSKKHSGSTLLVLLAVLAVAVFCSVFYFNPGLFGLHTQTYTNPPDLATAMNGGQPTVFGKPSLSAKQIDAVLAKWHSPAAGTGQALYDGSVKSGVNDLFAMGVFYAQSQYATLGAAPSNHSLGNFTQNGKLVYYVHWSESYTDFYTRARAAGKDDIQSVLDYLYIPGTVNILDVKKARADEPSLQLILSTMRELSKGE